MLQRPVMVRCKDPKRLAAVNRLLVEEYRCETGSRRRPLFCRRGCYVKECGGRSGVDLFSRCFVVRFGYERADLNAREKGANEAKGWKKRVDEKEGDDTASKFERKIENRVVAVDVVMPRDFGSEEGNGRRERTPQARQGKDCALSQERVEH
ncbi:hypothetical protein VTI74DRAFT_10607 [Chaetomium olivicolor]